MTFKGILWHLRKFIRTIKLSYQMTCAKTFGRRFEGGWDGEYEYNLYYWRGYKYYICGRVKIDERTN